MQMKEFPYVTCPPKIGLVIILELNIVDLPLSLSTLPTSLLLISLNSQPLLHEKIPLRCAPTILM
jgi:hypothetical protein